jgi:hypothetical protein
MFSPFPGSVTEPSTLKQAKEPAWTFHALLSCAAPLLRLTLCESTPRSHVAQSRARLSLFRQWTPPTPSRPCAVLGKNRTVSL